MSAANPRLRCLFVTACFLLLQTSLGWSQIFNVTNSTSTPIPGAGHDYIRMLSETVSPASGSVSLRLSVPMPRGRGLGIPFAFAYDSSGVWHPESVLPGGIITWYSNTGTLAKSGWSYTVPLLSEIVGQRTAPPSWTCNYSTDYVFTDPSGGRHALGLAMVYYPLSQGCLQAGTGLVSRMSGGDDLYRAYLPSNGGTGGSAYVADADGTAYWFPTLSAYSGPGSNSSLPFYIEDRNGNKITVNDQSNGVFSYTDTLGRAAISSSGFGASGNTLSVGSVSVWIL